MLGSKNKNTGVFDTMISIKTEFEGNLNFTGGLHVDGRIKGNIYADDNSGAVLRVSETAVIEGEIRVPSVIINGKVVGNVFSSQHIELAKKAMVSGDVHYTMMEMVMGAQVNGSLVHVEGQKSSKGRFAKKEPELPATEAIE